MHLSPGHCFCLARDDSAGESQGVTGLMSRSSRRSIATGPGRGEYLPGKGSPLGNNEPPLPRGRRKKNGRLVHLRGWRTRSKVLLVSALTLFSGSGQQRAPVRLILDRSAQSRRCSSEPGWLRRSRQDRTRYSLARVGTPASCPSRRVLIGLRRARSPRSVGSLLRADSTANDQ